MSNIRRPLPMTRMTRRLLVSLLFIASLHMSEAAVADPVGNFFRRLGDSIAHPNRTRKTSRTTKRRTSNKPVDPNAPGQTATSGYQDVSVPEPTPTVRAASAAPAVRGERRDLPFGIPVPNKTGFVTSPYSPKRGMVDVRN